MASSRIQVRRSRRTGRGKYYIRKEKWFDPYPYVLGTEPEKRIFDALIRRRQFFVYHGGSPDWVKSIAPGEPDHDVDFLLPEYRVILDPFDPYGHSQANSVPRDARKRALFEYAGFVTYFMWVIAPGVFVLDESTPVVGQYDRKFRPEIYKDKSGMWHLKQRKSAKVPHLLCNGADELLNALPLLNQPPRWPITDPKDRECIPIPNYRIGQHYGAGAGAVAAANHARARPPRMSIQLGGRGIGRSSGNKGGL